MAIVEGKGFNTGDGCVGYGEFGPPVAGNTGTGGEGKEKISALCVTGGTESNGTECAGVRCVGGVVVIKNLNVTAKLEAHGIEIWARHTGDNGGGAKGVRDTRRPRELVEAPDDLSDHVT